MDSFKKGKIYCNGKNGKRNDNNNDVLKLEDRQMRRVIGKRKQKFKMVVGGNYKIVDLYYKFYINFRNW